MFLGDLAFIIGLIGVVIYLCIGVISHTSKAGKLAKKGRGYEREIERLQARVEGFKAERDAVSPELNGLVERMIELRAVRDRLQMQYEEMQEKVRNRQIDIKTNVR